MSLSCLGALRRDEDSGKNEEAFPFMQKENVQSVRY